MWRMELLVPSQANRRVSFVHMIIYLHSYTFKYVHAGIKHKVTGEPLACATPLLDKCTSYGQGAK